MYSSLRSCPEGREERTARSRVERVESVLERVGGGRREVMVGIRDGFVVTRLVRSDKRESFESEAARARVRGLKVSASERAKARAEAKTYRVISLDLHLL